MSTNNPQPITVQIFILASSLALLWGVYFAWSVREWWRVQALRVRMRRDVVSAFRRMLVAWCVFILPASVLLRTSLVLVGAGDAVIGQILFFALAGSNLVGAIFAVVSLRVD